MIFACESLLARGAEVCYCGFQNYHGAATRCSDERQAIIQAGAVVFPINYPVETISELMKLNTEAVYFAGCTGNCPEGAVNYLRDERLQILNAIPTAEGALMIAIRETEFNVTGSDVLVLGFGRVGKAVAHVFKGIGANVTVALRNEKEAAICALYSCETCTLSQVAEAAARSDIIINTIPAKIFTSKEIDGLRENALVIDLASKPGGIDFEYAQKLGKKVIWALSLPSLVAPGSAGKLIADAVASYLERNAEV